MTFATPQTAQKSFKMSHYTEHSVHKDIYIYTGYIYNLEQVNK